MNEPGRRGSGRRMRPLRSVYVLPLIAVGATAIAVFFHSNSVPGTYAAQFQAQNAYDTSLYHAASLTAPTALTATDTGKSVTLAWIHATTTVKTKQVAAVYDQKTKTTCSSSTPAAYTVFTSLVPSLSTTANSDTDTSRATSGTFKAGDWLCYRVSSGVLTSWSASAYANVQVGFVATKLTLTGATGKITNTAKIIITFNQKLSAVPTNAHACTTTSKTFAVILGDTTATKTNKCATTNADVLGKLVSSAAPSRAEYYGTGSYTLTTTTTKLTLTLKAASGTKPTFTGTPKWTFIPNATLKYKTTTAVKVCTTNSHLVALCQPHVTTKKF